MSYACHRRRRRPPGSGAARRSCSWSGPPSPTPSMAGVPLRDAQILARHADPRSTEHYDRARQPRQTRRPLPDRIRRRRLNLWASPASLPPTRTRQKSLSRQDAGGATLATSWARLAGRADVEVRDRFARSETAASFPRPGLATRAPVRGRADAVRAPVRVPGPRTLARGCGARSRGRRWRHPLELPRAPRHPVAEPTVTPERAAKLTASEPTRRPARGPRDLHRGSQQRQPVPGASPTSQCAAHQPAVSRRLPAHLSGSQDAASLRRVRRRPTRSGPGASVDVS